MLNIVYFSNISENTHRFIQSLKWEGNVYRIPLRGEAEFLELEQYVIICPSYGSESQGHVPPQVRKFFANTNYLNLCVGVIGCGNVNFGPEFAAAGDIISKKLQVPLLYKFELAGTSEDIIKIREGLTEYDKQLNSSEEKPDSNNQNKLTKEDNKENKNDTNG